MNDFSKKELRDNYKSRTVIGGIYCIKCEENGRMWIKSTKDLKGQKNKFDFSVMTNSCLDNTMNLEWDKFGANTFSFSVLEELTKGDTQTDREFKQDLDLLHELWLEKMKE